MVGWSCHRWLSIGVVLCLGCGPSVGSEDGAASTSEGGTTQISADEDGAGPIDAGEGSSDAGTELPRACEPLDPTYRATTYVGAHRDVVSNGTALFIADSAGTLRRSIIHADGSDDEVLVPGLLAEHLAADDQWVYWVRRSSDSDSTELGKVAVDGSSSADLTSELAEVDALSVLAGDLYWVTEPGALESELRVLRADSSSPETVLTLDRSTLQLTSSAGLVYGVNGVWDPPGAASPFAVDAMGVEHTLAWKDETVVGGLFLLQVTPTWTHWVSDGADLWRTARSDGAPEPVFRSGDFDCPVGIVRAITGLGEDVYVALERGIVRVDAEGDAEVIALSEEGFYPSWIGTLGDDVVWHEIDFDADASAIVRLQLP